MSTELKIFRRFSQVNSRVSKLEIRDLIQTDSGGVKCKISGEYRNQVISQPVFIPAMLMNALDRGQKNAVLDNKFRLRPASSLTVPQ